MQLKLRPYCQKQSGNVLFLILLAVVLFAALSYAVTNSVKGGGNNATSEKDTLTASHLIQYANEIESAVTRMRLTGGCRETDISFETSQVAYNFAHTPPVSEACKVFSSSGGNVSFQSSQDWFTDQSDATWRTWFSTDIGVLNVGTTKPELTYTLWGVTSGVCQKVNEKLGIPGSSPPLNPLPNASTNFTGAYATTATDIIGTGAASVMANQPSGCVAVGGADGYVFYHTIIAK